MATFRPAQIFRLLVLVGGAAILDGTPWAQAVNVIEYYNASQDHYFISSLQADIDALDSGHFRGWTRTGLSFMAYSQAVGSASPVCRFYIPPANGDSHFYSASPAECAQVQTKFPFFDYESPSVMYIDLPDTTTGACPSGETPVYRVWDKRTDTNHRYTTNPGSRAQMITKGWAAEGYGPDLVIMCAPVDASVTYSGPLVITKGGTYSGNWESQDPTVAAVKILTSEPVVITNCNIRGKSHLINGQYVLNAHVTINNCRGYGLDPRVAGQQRGDFYFGFQQGSLTIEHNYMEATKNGVRVIATDGWTLDGPFLIRFNQVRNLDSAPSDGKGGRILTFPDAEHGNVAFQIAAYQNTKAVEIAWNEIESDPTNGWISGDVINIWSSSGTLSTPIEIHDNYIFGGYPAVPTASLYWAGAITMDGKADNTAATATAFVKIHDNQIVAHSNFGIGLAAGHDNEAYANRIVSTGQFADGGWYVGYAGIYVIDCACYQQPPSVYFNNFAHDNVVGFRFERAAPSNPDVFTPPPIRLDYLLPDCAGGASGPMSKCTNNISLPDPVTSATEANEYVLWQQKLQSNGISVGPQTAQGAAFAVR